jgi:hypothetical protein
VHVGRSFTVAWRWPGPERPDPGQARLGPGRPVRGADRGEWGAAGSGRGQGRGSRIRGRRYRSRGGQGRGRSSRIRGGRGRGRGGRCVVPSGAGRGAARVEPGRGRLNRNEKTSELERDRENRALMEVIGSLHGTSARSIRYSIPLDWLRGRAARPDSTHANSDCSQARQNRPS